MEREPLNDRPLPTGILERYLASCVALGAVRSFSFEPTERRKWTITFPNGDVVRWEAGRVESFCLGALIASEVTT